MGTESYKHKFAKATLAGWLRDICVSNVDDYVNLSPARWRVNRGGPHYGVWEEYPVCLNEKNNIIGVYDVWDEFPFFGSSPPINYPADERPPSYEETLGMGLCPIVIFDIAIQHKGAIVYAFEVVHRHAVSHTKSEYLNRINICSGVYEIDADWILSRIKRPEALVCSRVA